jgi:hypothetical protein
MLMRRQLARRPGVVLLLAAVGTVALVNVRER